MKSKVTSLSQFYLSRKQCRVLIDHLQCDSVKSLIARVTRTALLLFCACSVLAVIQDVEAGRLPAEVRVEGSPLLSLEFVRIPDGELTSGELRLHHGDFLVRGGRLMMKSQKQNPKIEVMAELPEDIVVELVIGGLAENHILNIVLPNGLTVCFSRQFGSVGVFASEDQPFGAGVEPLVVAESVWDVIAGLDENTIVVACQGAELKVWVNGFRLLEARDLKTRPSGKMLLGSGWNSDLKIESLLVHKVTAL